MKAQTLFCDGHVAVIVENEHKEVFVQIEEVNKKFTSFDNALNWAQKEVFNGSCHCTRTNQDVSTFRYIFYTD